MTDKLLRAKVGIVLEQPFFACLLMRKRFVPDTSIDTAVTNGQIIRFNPQFFDSLSPEELKAVICKQIMHTALLHPFRREGREMNKWKTACDYASAQFIHNAGMILPHILTHPEYDNMSAEDIYKQLKNSDNDCEGQGSGALSGGTGQGEGDGEGQAQGNGQNGDNSDPNNDPNGCGTFEDSPPENRSQQEAEAKQEMAQALNIAKSQGKLPADHERLYELLEAKVPWKEVLSRFLTEAAKNDYSFSRPNRRYLQSGFVLPSLYNLEVGEIVFMVDTSGSISEKELNQVATEIHDVASSFAAKITVIYIDAAVAGVQEIEPFDDIKLEPKGGGGTDFRPGFDYLKENGIVPKSVVYLTDGCCDDFPDEPDFPVLWCITYGNDFEPPFGETIKIETDEDD